MPGRADSRVMQLHGVSKPSHPSGDFTHGSAAFPPYSSSPRLFVMFDLDLMIVVSVEGGVPAPPAPESASSAADPPGLADTLRVPLLAAASDAPAVSFSPTAVLLQNRFRSVAPSVRLTARRI